jgi:hypothetical protein
MSNARSHYSGFKVFVFPVVGCISIHLGWRKVGARTTAVSLTEFCPILTGMRLLFHSVFCFVSASSSMSSSFFASSTCS